MTSDRDTDLVAGDRSGERRRHSVHPLAGFGAGAKAIFRGLGQTSAIRKPHEFKQPLVSYVGSVNEPFAPRAGQLLIEASFEASS
jgi:hypothetical protein